jgi:hypothetical protein
MPHHNPNISQWFLSFVYVLSKLHVFTWLQVSLFHLVEQRGQGVMVGVTRVAMLLKGDYGDP